MKAKDLMIDNWVLYLNKPCIVNQITHEWFEFIYKDDNGKTKYFDYDFNKAMTDEPKYIPLTAEILEKNGFKHYAENMYEYYELAEDYYSIEAKEINDGLWRIKVEHEEIFNDTEICCVSYVHQLQNFLRLCGIDIEIKL